MTDLFTTVMTAAGDRCQCTGECGARQKHGDGRRCERVAHAGAALVAAPADPGCSVAEAARLPVTDLMAWCSECLSKAEARARRIHARQATAELTAAQGDLFGEWSA